MTSNQHPKSETNNGSGWIRRIARNLAVGATVAVVAGAATLGWAAQPALAGPSCEADGSIDSEEQELLGLMNDYRQQNGLAALEFSDVLNRAAAWKSQDMGVNGYYDHTDTPTGRTWSQRIRDCGYTHNTWIGETLAVGSEDAAIVFDQWRNSPSHNDKMLSSNFVAVGIARVYVDGSPYGWYWTADFGGVADGSTPQPSPTDTPPAASPACADFTGDGFVNMTDILVVVQHYFTADPATDLDGSGSVGTPDIMLAAGQYGTSCSA